MEEILADFSLYQLKFGPIADEVKEVSPSTIEMTIDHIYNYAFCTEPIVGKQYFRFFAITNDEKFNAGVSFLHYDLKNPAMKPNCIGVGFQSGLISYNFQNHKYVQRKGDAPAIPSGSEVVIAVDTIEGTCQFFINGQPMAQIQYPKLKNGQFYPRFLFSSTGQRLIAGD